MKSIVGVIILLVHCIVQVTAQDYSIVDAKVGRIRGTKASDGDYYEFMGIPYGQVDANNPFGEASPYPDFEEVFEATDGTSQCPQSVSIFNSGSQDNTEFVGDLDCLHMNIYVPTSTNSSRSLPVMFWVHGGVFEIGTGNRRSAGPRFIVNHDVILVSVNYRLNFYGFMCLNIPEVPGNQGIKDLVMALKWVKNNIEYFGGDKNKVTAFGQSAGGMALDLLLYTDEEDLFQQVMIMSGTVFTPLVVRPPDDTIPITLAQRLGFTTSDLHEAISFLSTKTPHEFLGASSGLETRPCKERVFSNVKSLLTEFPVNMAVPRVKDMPILLGFTSDELISVFGNLPEEVLQQIDTFDEQIRRAFHFDEDTHNEIVRLMKNFYVGDKGHTREALSGISNFQADVRHVYPTERSLAKLLANGAEKAYYYKFSYVGDRNVVRVLTNTTAGGAAHGDDLGYLLDSEALFGIGTPEDFTMVEKVTKLWTNFAKYGDPTPETSELLPVKWIPVTQGSPRYYLNIDSELTLEQRPFQERLTFWDLFMKAYGEYEYGFARDSSTSLSSTLLVVVIGFIISLLSTL